MGELKFASVDDAIQHLSNITERRVKIAWEDESREMLRAIALEIQNTPGLLTKLKKSKAFNADKIFQEAGVDKDAQILPTSKGQLKIVQEFPKEAVMAVVNSLSGVKDPKERAKIIDYVINDEAFKVFHAKYPKGVQKDESGPYYRGKGSLLERGVDKLTGEKGEEGEKDRVERQKLEDEEEANAAITKELTKSVMSQVKNMFKTLPESESKDDFEVLLGAPSNPTAQDEFIKTFKEDIKNGKVNAKDASLYLKMVQRMAKYAKEKFGDKLPEFIKSLESLVPEVDKAEDKAKDEGEVTEKKSPPGDTPKEEGRIINPKTGKPFGASEMDSMINNIINEWIGIKKSK